jgi:hypothetical protein
MERLLAGGQIVMHPFIVAEIALGSLRNRASILLGLDSLLGVKVARLEEVRHMIDARLLSSKGIGLTDAHLAASCLITPGTRLWTRVGALKGVARDLNMLAEL